MGIKCSMITISQPGAVNERALLDSLGFTDYSFVEDTTLEECMYPRDKSINIGYFNNHLVICDDFQCTEALDQLRRMETLTDYEQVLTSLFPQSEILTTVCHSVVNYHAYALVRSSKRLRFKSISGDIPVTSYGELLAEEVPIYTQSSMTGERLLFRSSFGTPDRPYEFTEDQMMEDFAFGVAKRHLGVEIGDDDEVLMFNTTFKKYKRVKFGRTVWRESVPATAAAVQPASGGSWLGRLLKSLRGKG
jgi:hypothetical protein